MSIYTGELPQSPRWWSLWLALLAPTVIISPMAIFALPVLNRLPRQILWLLGFYALTQQVPALFSPDPVLASLLAMIRTLLMLGLISVGVALRDRSRLRSFTVGLGVVFGTSLVYFLISAHDLSTLRLTHPYMTSTTLGLAGAIGAWFALFNPSQALSRVLLGLSSIGVLVFSGSRSALIATVISSVVALLAQNKRIRRSVILGGFVVGATVVVIGQHYEVAPIQRMTNLDTTDRDVIWSDTLSVISQNSISGVGTYLLGRSLAPTAGACKLFPTAEGQVQACPAWLARLGSPWLIAHNLTLQQLAETGPLGLAGLLALLSVVVVTCLASREPFGVAVIIGLLLSSALDNTLLVPSPFFAEMFWIVAGMQLARAQVLTPLGFAAPLLLLPILSLPLIGVFLPERHFPATLRYLSAARQVPRADDYGVMVQFGLAPGHYRVNLRSCITSCASLVTLPFDVGDQPAGLLSLEVALRPVATQRVELRLFSGRSSLKSVPNVQYSWTVRVKP